MATCALIIALDLELNPFIAAWGLEALEVCGGPPARAVTGVVAGHRVIAVRCGLGKVNAAWATCLAAERFGAGILVSVGTAGGLDPRLGVGDIVVADGVAQHDVWRAGTRVHVAANEPEFNRVYPCDPELRRAALGAVAAAAQGTGSGSGPPAAQPGDERGPRLVGGRVVTGDVPVAATAVRERLQRKFGAVCVDMEAGAVAQTAARMGRRFLAVKGISDSAAEGSHGEFLLHCRGVCRSLPPVVANMLEALPR